MNRAIVLGAEGFVGKPFSEYLSSTGREVLKIDIKNGAINDLRREKIAIRESDEVYFLAWDVGGAKYLYREDTQLHQIEWNVELLWNIMNQLREVSTPFVFVSSQIAQDSSTAYGVTKRLGELWARSLGGNIVRLWNVYGPMESDSERSHVVSDFVQQAISTGEINMLTKGDEHRRFVHINDVSRALVLACEPRGVSSHIYDIAGDTPVSVRYVADMIANLTNAKVVSGNMVGSESPYELGATVPAG